jgi:hypothetical protein
MITKFGDLSITPFIPKRALVYIFSTSIKAKSRATSSGSKASTLSSSTYSISLNLPNSPYLGLSYFFYVSGDIYEPPVLVYAMLIMAVPFLSDAPYL